MPRKRRKSVYQKGKYAWKKQKLDNSDDDCDRVCSGSKKWRVITMSNDDPSRHIEENEKVIKSLLFQLGNATGQQKEIIKKLKEANKKQRAEIDKQEGSIIQLERLEEEKKELETRFDKDIQELKEMLFKAEEQKKQDKEVNDKLKQHISDIDIERDRLKSNITELCTERDDLKSQLRRAEQNRDEYKNQVDDWVKKRHETVHVQMYAAVNKELFEKMMNELEEMLSNQFEINKTLIQVEKYKDPPPDSRAPLLVLCINASRLGTDVKQALQNVNRTRILAVVVLHHKEIHALPCQQSEKLLTGSEYKDINLIVDIVYQTTKGIYPCDMNNKSLERLFSFIKSHS